MKPRSKRRRKQGSGIGEQVCSAVLNQGELVGRETLPGGDFLTLITWAAAIKTEVEQIQSHPVPLSATEREMENGKSGIWRLFQYGP